MNEFGLKLALLSEYKRVIRYQRMYEELCERNFYLAKDLLGYYEKNKLEVADKKGVLRILEKVADLIEYRIKVSDETLQGEQPDGDLPEPEWDNSKSY